MKSQTRASWCPKAARSDRGWAESLRSSRIWGRHRGRQEGTGRRRWVVYSSPAGASAGAQHQKGGVVPRSGSTSVACQARREPRGAQSSVPVVPYALKACVQAGSGGAIGAPRGTAPAPMARLARAWPARQVVPVIIGETERSGPRHRARHQRRRRDRRQRVAARLPDQGWHDNNPPGPVQLRLQ